VMRTQSAFPPFPATRSHHLTKILVSRDGTAIAPPSPPLMENFYFQERQVTFQAETSFKDRSRYLWKSLYSVFWYLSAGVPSIYLFADTPPLRAAYSAVGLISLQRMQATVDSDGVRPPTSSIPRPGASRQCPTPMYVHNGALYGADAGF
jgi:hypothetical protein